MEPNTLIFKLPNQPKQILRVGQPYMGEDAKQLTRLPAGHPEGFYEAFANIYKLVIEDIRRLQAGQKPIGGYPSVYDG
ncbi:MAG TPA: oxidoreductase, partial [Ktedonobacter sp.]|nr:oxidoreductase [Ktedonobacter sp.]